jgi:hypothetical protein
MTPLELNQSEPDKRIAIVHPSILKFISASEPSLFVRGSTDSESNDLKPGDSMFVKSEVTLVIRVFCRTPEVDSYSARLELDDSKEAREAYVNALKATLGLE